MGRLPGGIWRCFPKCAHMVCCTSPNRTIVGQSVKDMKFLNGDLINLVDNIYARHVDAIALYHVNQIICCSIKPQRNICIVDLIFTTDCLDCLKIQMSGGHCWCKTYPSFVLPLETHIWRLCIQPGKEEQLRTELLNSRFPFDDNNLWCTYCKCLDENF